MTDYDPNKEVNKLAGQVKSMAADVGFYALLLFSFIVSLVMLIYSKIAG